ncbi:unnamed protein product, partial [Staurois parvus]
MALGRKGFTCGVIKGLTVYCVLVLSTASTLLCMALHSRAIQSSVQELT